MPVPCAHVLAFASTHPQAILGLAPEGGDQPGGLLNWPPAGAGRFILLLAEQGFPLLPVGCFEQAGVFCRDERLRAGLGRNGRDYVRKNYRWDVILSKYERMMGKLKGK